MITTHEELAKCHHEISLVAMIIKTLHNSDKELHTATDQDMPEDQPFAVSEPIPVRKGISLCSIELGDRPSPPMGMVPALPHTLEPMSDAARSDSAPTGPVLAVDAGQSSTRVRCKPGPWGPGWMVTSSGVRTALPLAPQFATVMADVVTAHPEVIGSDCTVAIGSSGARDDEDPTPVLEALKPYGVARVLLAHDSITSYLGALGDQLGVVTAAGTGVITLAVGHHDVARVDGWGYVIGDAGSAFWLGRHALDAVMRAHDGRGEQTVLSETIGGDFDDIEAAYLELHADPLMVSHIAAYSAKVTAAAEEGDHVARDICVRAAHELAHSSITGLRQTHLTDEDSPAVGLLGGVMRSRLIHAAIVEKISVAMPGARIVEPLGEGLDGAAALTAVSPDSPLGQRIHVAR